MVGGKIARRIHGGQSISVSSHALNESIPALVYGVYHCQFPAVDLSNFMKMDPYLLVGLLNTELRNHCDSLEDLVKTHNLQHEAVIAKMAAIDYIYQPEQNQFR